MFPSIFGVFVCWFTKSIRDQKLMKMFGNPSYGEHFQTGYIARKTSAPYAERGSFQLCAFKIQIQKKMQLNKNGVQVAAEAPRLLLSVSPGSRLSVTEGTAETEVEMAEVNGSLTGHL